MGAYNDVRAPMVCPQCGETVTVEVQFMVGEVDQHHYALGDEVRFDSRARAKTPRGRIVGDGECAGCPACGYRGDWPAYVFLEDDRFVRVTAATPESFIVLD